MTASKLYTLQETLLRALWNFIGASFLSEVHKTETFNRYDKWNMAFISDIVQLKKMYTIGALSMFVVVLNWSNFTHYYIIQGYFPGIFWTFQTILMWLVV